LIVASFSVPVPVAAAATTIPGGDVSGTWAMGGSPYLIGGDITVRRADADDRGRRRGRL
jgi:hypothetical protein